MIGNKKALVTGAAGFVARHLMPLLNVNYDLFGIDPKYKPEKIPYDAYFRERFENMQYYSMFPEFDVIVHLAANIQPIDKRMEFGIEAYQDIALDLAVANFVEKHPPKKAFVYMSSCATDAPSDPYGWVKLTGEKVFYRLYQMGVPVVILRPFSGYGSDQEETYPFPAILKRVLAGENPVKVWGSGYQVRDWIHVDDLARAICWAIERAPRGEPIDIGTGIGTNFYALAELMIELTFEGTARLEISSQESKPESSRARIAEHFKAEALGFRPEIGLRDGIVRAIKEMKATNVPA